MLKSSKLVAARKGGTEVLLVRRRKDGRWMFPGGRRKRGKKESLRRCLMREIRQELPDVTLRGVKLWKKLNGKNHHSGKRMSDACFMTAKAKGALTIGDRKELKDARWCRPWGLKLTPTTRHMRDLLVANGYLSR